MLRQPGRHLITCVHAPFFRLSQIENVLPVAQLWQDLESLQMEDRTILRHGRKDTVRTGHWSPVLSGDMPRYVQMRPEVCFESD